MRQTRNGTRGPSLEGRSERRVSGPVKGRRGVDPGELAASELRSITALARRLSLTPDDADEAVQRGLEILLRRAESLEAPTAGAWLRTVVKHEAFAVRAERLRLSPVDPADFRHVADRHDVAEAASLLDRFKVASEALSGVKPGEAEALLLQAEGLTYKDIASDRGWTYTKVNRLINEGSRAFRTRVEEIESGTACSTVPKAKGAVLTAAHRGHLSRCSACRSELAEERSRSSSFAITLPALLAIPAVALRGFRNYSASVADRLTTSAVKAQAAIEAASASKVAVVAASAAALAGGGVAAVEGASKARHDKERPVVARTAVIPSSAAISVAAEPVSAESVSAPRAEPVTSAPSTVSADEAPAAEFDPGQGALSTATTRAPAQPARVVSQPRNKQSTPEFGP